MDLRINTRNDTIMDNHGLLLCKVFSCTSVIHARIAAKSYEKTIKPKGPIQRIGNEYFVPYSYHSSGE